MATIKCTIKWKAGRYMSEVFPKRVTHVLAMRKVCVENHRTQKRQGRTTVNHNTQVVQCNYWPRRNKTLHIFSWGGFIVILKPRKWPVLDTSSAVMSFVDPARHELVLQFVSSYAMRGDKYCYVWCSEWGCFGYGAGDSHTCKNEVAN